MSMFTAFNISASGMTAQQLRTDVISENIANADTTRTSDGTPYVRKAVVFTEKTMTGTALGKSAYGSYGTGAYSTFSDALRLANGGVADGFRREWFVGHRGVADSVGVLMELLPALLFKFADE